MTLVPIVILFCILNAFFLRYLSISSNASPHELLENGFVLKMHPLGKIMGFIVIGFGPIISWLIASNSDLDLGTALVIITIPLVFLALGLLIILYSKNHTVDYNEKEIIITNTFKKERKVPWEDIQKIHLNHFLNLYAVKTKNGKFYINQYLKGINAFLIIAEELQKKNVA